MIHDPSSDNGIKYLVKAIVATKLNLANGVLISEEVSQTFDEADDLVGDLVPPPIGDGFISMHDAALLVEYLTEFNEGNGGVAVCPDTIFSTATFATAHPVNTAPVATTNPNNYPDDNFPESTIVSSASRPRNFFSLFVRPFGFR